MRIVDGNGWPRSGVEVTVTKLRTGEELSLKSVRRESSPGTYVLLASEHIESDQLAHLDVVEVTAVGGESRFSRRATVRLDANRCEVAAIDLPDTIVLE